MAKISYLTNPWDAVKEVDLRPLRQEALQGVQIALVGAMGVGRAALADRMRRDPARPHLEVDTPLWILDLDNVDQAFEADIIILIVDPAKPDFSQEKELAKTFSNQGKKVLIFLHQLGEPDEMLVLSPESEWGKRRVVWGSVDDTKFLLEKFAPAVISLIPGKLLSLGRYFPLFRVQIAHYLINDNCATNAAYALSTGLAETVAA